MNIKRIIKNITLFSLILLATTSCRSTEAIQTSSINKNISIDAKIASIDAYGNITLNIVSRNIFDANFNYDSKLILEFSNGYLIESYFTSSNNDIEEGKCYLRAVGEENPITIGIKSENLAEVGTLEIGDLVEIYQLKLN